jgi:signal transduction histidine kinase
LHTLFSRNNVLVLIFIAAAASSLALFSYLYTSSTADSIANVAAQDARSNADIQAHDLASIMVNKMESVRSNLQILSNATAVQNQDVRTATPLFTSAKLSTIDFVSSYFWVGADGRLLWADAFTNKTIEQKYNGDDRSYRPYYSSPKDTLEPYYSTIIESVDGVPRLYVAYPILRPSEAAATPASGMTFKGVVVAAVNLDVMGKFLQSQLSSKYHSTTGMMDKNGLLLYSTNGTYIGKNIFGPEVQSILPQPIKDSFNNFIRESLRGKPGQGDISYLGQTSTIAYQPVSIKGNDFAMLYITTPHELAGNVNSLIDQLRTFNAILIMAIGAVAIGIALITLTWNKRLAGEVAEKTSELKDANKNLAESNQRLEAVNVQVESANKQLQLANEQLQNNDKMQREFINIAAHELRTPTQAILGFSELFDMRPEVRDEAMRAVARNAARLERLTSDILDVSKIEGNALKLSKEKFSIKEVILSAIEDAKSRLVNGDSADLKIVYDGSDTTVLADKARLYQVISNLIANSIKFTKKGIISITTEQRNSERGNELIVSVKDTGAGIDPDIVSRLFTKFTSRSQTGTGLGLFISKSIVEAHGGSIQGTNNLDGKGATFAFTLPLLENS